MATEFKQILLAPSTYSEYHDPNNPDGLDPDSLLTARATANVIAEYSCISGVVIGTKVLVDKDATDSITIAVAMKNVIVNFFRERSLDLPDDFIEIELKGTSTRNEAANARRVACGLPILGVSMEYHQPRSSRNLEEECPQPTWVLSTEKILKKYEPEYLEGHKSWLEGPQERKRHQRERLTNMVDSTPLGAYLGDKFNQITGGRKLNQQLLALFR